MNPNESTGYELTRRDFMKKSALTVGAITLLGAGIGLAAGESGSSWWDMKCIWPHKGADQTAQQTAQVGIPFTAALEINVVTDTGEDSASDAPYNACTVTHHFWLDLTSGGITHQAAGKNVFQVDCISYTGVINSSFLPSSSTPASGTSVSSPTFAIGNYDVVLTIYTAHDQGQGKHYVESTINGKVEWSETLNPNNKGVIPIPQLGHPLKMLNSFKATGY